MRACTRSIAAPAARSWSTSAASLRIRSSLTIGPARVCAASGRASRSPNTCFAGIVSATASRVGPPARSLTSRYGSSPSFQVTTSTPRSASGRPGPARRLQPRHDQRGRRAVPGRGQHEAGEPLVARAVRVEEVAQVGARGDQQQVDAVVGGDVARPPDAVGEQRGGNGRSRVARSHVPQYAPPPCVIPATRAARRRSHVAPVAPRITPSHTAIGPPHPAQQAAAVAQSACDAAVGVRHAATATGGRRAAALAHCGTVARPLMLLDAASLYFRAFYGVPESITAPDGTPVNAVRGFCDMVSRLLTERRPARLVACLDLEWRPAFRVDALPVLQGAPGRGRTRDGPGRDPRGGAGRAEPPGAGDPGRARRRRAGHRGRRRPRGRRRHRHAVRRGEDRPGRGGQRRPRPHAGRARRADPGAAGLRRARAGQGGDPRAAGGRREVRRAGGPRRRGVRGDGDAARRPVGRAAGGARASGRRPRRRWWAGSARGPSCVRRWTTAPTPGSARRSAPSSPRRGRTSRSWSRWCGWRWTRPSAWAGPTPCRRPRWTPQRLAELAERWALGGTVERLVAALAKAGR